MKQTIVYFCLLLITNVNNEIHTIFYVRQLIICAEIHIFVEIKSYFQMMLKKDKLQDNSSKKLIELDTNSEYSYYIMTTLIFLKVYFISFAQATISFGLCLQNN
ncbi:hypothetical protein V1478_010686 [Vespula squamosa]|uniref:Uncharacterized protein n=1 Tax=Vespula squamosa TaxID=30214 RepID=A0ABD2AIR5_VESSQ